MEINDKTVELIISGRFNEDFWIFQLGRSEALQTSSVDDEHQLMSSFFDNGQKIWNLYLDKIQNILCDKVNRVPKEFVQEVTSGNIKDLAVNIITVLSSTYNLTLAVSIPLCALALKKGINNICK